MVSNICYFHPETWGRFPFWLFLQMGSKPPTRFFSLTSKEKIKMHEVFSNLRSWFSYDQGGRGFHESERWHFLGGWDSLNTNGKTNRTSITFKVIHPGMGWSNSLPRICLKTWNCFDISIVFAWTVGDFHCEGIREFGDFMIHLLTTVEGATPKWWISRGPW